MNNYPNLYVIRDWGGAPVFLYNYIYGLLIINDVILIVRSVCNLFYTIGIYIYSIMQTNYVDSELYSSSLSLPELKWIKANFPLNLPKTVRNFPKIISGDY